MVTEKPSVLITNNSDVELPQTVQELEFVIKKAINLTIDHITPEGLSKDQEISVALIDNHQMQVINNNFRGKNKPTNVLSFPFLNYKSAMLDEEVESIALGEIIISLEKMIEEAEQQNKAFNNHLFHLTVHSALHLFGFDHKV